METQDSHLLCLTREDLRQELLAFTEEVLRQQLVDLAANVQRDLRDELRRCLENANVGSNGYLGHTSHSSHGHGANTLGQTSFSSHGPDSPQMGQIPEAWPLIKDDAEELRAAGKGKFSALLKAQRRFMAHKPIRTNTLKNIEDEMDTDEEEEDVNIDSGDDMSDSGDRSNRMASPKVAPVSTSNASTIKSKGPSSVKSKSMHTTQEALKASAQHRRFEVKGPTLSFNVANTRRARLINVRARKIVKSPYFDMCVNLIILANAIYIGILTHYMALQKEDDIPRIAEVMETLFFVAFTCEMGLRLFVHRCELFQNTLPSGRINQDIYWNILDCTVIVLQSTEMFFRYIRIDQSITTRISVIRVLRLARVVRIVRLLKVFRFIHDLRMIVYSIWRSLSIFLWSVIALLSMTFMWSVYFTQVATDFIVVNKSSDGTMSDVVDDLDAQFGSMTRTMLSLIQAVMGGVDWRDLTTTLTHVSWYLAVIPLVAYVTFAQLAMMNVITGVFLESAMSRAKKETEIYLVRNARKVFRAADADQTGLIHWKDFERALHNEGVNDFFEAIDIDISEARTLFDLLDLSGDGVVSADEFLSGCLRVKGSAKALDLLVFSRQVEMLFANGISSRPGSLLGGTASETLEGEPPSTDRPGGHDAIS